VGEIPSKGGMDVNLDRRKEACHVDNVLTKSLEGVGCIAEDGRENCSMVVAGFGEMIMPVVFEVEIGQERS
jgi:hypothetical protein